MRHLLFFTVVMTTVCALVFPLNVMAQRYHPQEEIESGISSICTQNHLREDCWYLDGCFMHYSDDGFTSCVGVDVSKWNGDIDFDTLKQQGVEFVIVRAGFRGYETGDIVADERFSEYVEGALNAGLKVGAYFYSQAIDEDEAVEEAMFVLDSIAGYDIEMPVYFDTEDVRQGESRTDIMATANFNMNAKAFCETIESYGYRAGIYASQEWIRKNLDLAQLADYEIWYASYNSTPGREHGFDMWQYTDSGCLEGCYEYLDLNVRVERIY